MPRPEPVLICALSGRALAQAARAAGFAPIVLDAFGDLDTRDAAEDWHRLPVDGAWRFRRGPLLAAAARLAPAPIPLVWGSGFERHAMLLAELAVERPVWGNRPAVVQAVKDPGIFASAMRSLVIAHPEIRDRPPADPTGWLCKRAGSAGGSHVRQARMRPPRGRGWYWQRRARGRPVSALLLGDRVLGFSEQWTAPRPGRRFRFGGAVAPARLTAVARDRFTQAASSLATHFELRGLGSVDALVAGDEVTVLEANPRPGAALDAYQGALGLDLFSAHVEACRGRVVPEIRPCDRAAGSLIVHAMRALQIPWPFDWPSWTADRSPEGTSIAAGGPICTVLAQGADPMSVRAVLDVRNGAILALLTPAAGHRSSGG